MTLRDLRLNVALSQKQLAGKVGVTEITVWNWENGHNAPRISYIRPLAEALGVSIPELRAAIQETANQKK